MTDHSPGVPSPPEELRQEIAAALLTANFLRGNEFDAAVLAEKVLPLFAARVAAIDAQRETLARYFEQWGSAAPPTRGEWNALVCERDEARAEVKAWVENFREGFAASERMRIAAEAERDRFREHSVQLNTIGWKLAEAVGGVGAGDTEVGGDQQERLARLVAERDEARVKADTYQRMYYAEHGEVAAELTALQQRVAELTAENADLQNQVAALGKACLGHIDAAQHLAADLDRAYSQRNDVLDSMAAERTQAAAQANLGLATTRELLAELTARIDTDYVMGGGGLDYSTVNGRPGGDDHE